MITISSLRGLAKLIALTFTFLLTPAGPALTQAKTTLAGMVIDDSGAVIARASIAAINDETHLVFTTTTDLTGHYQITDLPVGRYTVKANVSGFETSERTGVQLTTSESTELTFTMHIGGGPVGEIHFKIQTPSGTIIPGATIEVSAVATGATWHGTSDPNGEYVLSEMPCVDYDVKVSASNGRHSRRRIHVNKGLSRINRIVLQ
jgi:hypothetical protein